jgi:hypothetical protein
VLVPGHDRPGTELVNDAVAVDDGVLDVLLRGTCSFPRAFDCAG